MNIGVSETLIGTAVCGIIFSLFSGQPLIIIGTTGPLLLFDEMLFQVYIFLLMLLKSIILCLTLAFLYCKKYSFFVKDYNIKSNK